jgi:hypothetical protein
MFGLSKNSRNQKIQIDSIRAQFTHLLIFFNGIFQEGFLDVICHERLSSLMIPSVFLIVPTSVMCRRTERPGPFMGNNYRRYLLPFPSLRS